MDGSGKKKILIIAFSMLAVILGLIVFLAVRPDKSAGEGKKPYNLTVSVGESALTDRNISWYTETDSRVSLVRYCERENNDCNLKSGKGSFSEKEGYYEETVLMKPVSGQESSSSPELEECSRIRHVVFLDGLKPGTSYRYIAGDGVNWSDENYFTTADGSIDRNGEFGFLIFSDMQGFVESEFEKWATVYNSAVRKYPDALFSVILGDMVEEQKNALSWEYAIGIPHNIGSMTVVPVAGNKDDRMLMKYFPAGSEADVTAGIEYYSFDAGGVHFTVLNTGDGEKTISKKQLKWLKTDLSSDSAKSASFRVVLVHKAPYSDANHADDEEIVVIRSQLLPVFEEYGVDIVLSGHDHYYFRSEPVREKGSEIVPYTETNAEINGEKVSLIKYDGEAVGVVYFVSSSSGVKQYSKSFREMPEILAKRSENLNKPTYTYCSVSEGRIAFLTYQVNVFRDTAEFFDGWGITRY